jgi:cytochrome oxidase Cu insertion factor (SCO1/SenC/PrrC family)
MKQFSPFRKGVCQMIKKSPVLVLLLATLAIPALAQQPTASPAPQPKTQLPVAQQPAPPQTHLKVGQPAPDFTLTDTEGKQVSLHDFKGKQNVVLAFYVLAFTGG